MVGVDFGVLSQLSSLTYSFGVVSIFFIASVQPGRLQRVVIAILLGLPMMFLAMTVGMKEEIFFPIVPAAVLYWFGFRSIMLKTIVICLGFIVLAYSQMYVHYVRDVSWGHGTKYNSRDLISGFQQHLKTTTLADGMDSMNSRMNMTISRAITVAIADRNGFEPYNIFGPIPGSVIPRFLWPNKPVLQPGAQHTIRILGLNRSEFEATSSTAAGFFSELYLGGGYIGWFLGVIGYAVLLANIQIFTLKKIPGFGHLALSFVSVYWTLRFEENHIVYAYTSLIFIFIFLFFCNSIE